MIECKTKKWGNSLGLILPKTEVDKLGIGENVTLGIEVVMKGNPLKDMFGAGKDDKKITRKEFKKWRRDFDMERF